MYSNQKVKCCVYPTKPIAAAVSVMYVVSRLKLSIFLLLFKISEISHSVFFVDIGCKYFFGWGLQKRQFANVAYNLN